MLREHLRVPGMGRTTASRFRDKLAMRMQARTLGIPVPEFSPVFNDQEVADWAAASRRPGCSSRDRRPPRSASRRSTIATRSGARSTPRATIGRSACSSSSCRARSTTSTRSSGTAQVVFAVAFKYGRPPMEVSHQGGIFITRRLPDDSDEARAAARDEPHAAGGARPAPRRLAHGVHQAAGEAEPERQPDGFVFLETSARVGGAFIVDTIEAATGINLWREWAKVEIAGEHGDYAVPPHRDDYAGIVLTLARQEAPDMSSYTDPEIVTTIRKDFHAGLIVRSPDPQRVEALIADYTRALLPRFLRHRAAARASGRMIKRSLKNVWSPQRRNRRDVDVYLPASYAQRHPLSGRLHAGRPEPVGSRRRRLPAPGISRRRSTASHGAASRRSTSASTTPDGDRLDEYSPFPDRAARRRRRRRLSGVSGRRR